MLEWVEIATAGGPRAPRARASSGSAYRRSNLAAGRSSRAPALLLAAADPEQVKATLAEMRRRRHEAQPQA